MSVKGYDTDQPALELSPTAKTSGRELWPDATVGIVVRLFVVTRCPTFLYATTKDAKLSCVPSCGLLSVNVCFTVFLSIVYPYLYSWLLKF